MLFKKVLIANDFSVQSEQLLQCARELKNFGLTEVILVNVVNIQTAGGNAAELQQHNQNKLDFEKNTLESEGFIVKALSVIGFPSAEIERIAEEENASVILMASHGAGFIKNIFLGSTASKIIHSTLKTIYLEKFQTVEPGACSKRFSSNFKKVLLPLDLQKDYQPLISLLKKNVLPVESLVLSYVISTSEMPETSAILLKEAEDVLTSIKNDISELYPDVSIVISQGVPSAKIIDIAEQENVSLIMMAKKHKKTLGDKILGSVTERVARNSHCSLLLLCDCQLGEELV